MSETRKGLAAYRRTAWPASGQVGPRRWPLKLSLLLLLSLCATAWVLLGGALHILYQAVT